MIMMVTESTAKASNKYSSWAERKGYLVNMLNSFFLTHNYHLCTFSSNIEGMLSEGGNENDNQYSN